MSKSDTARSRTALAILAPLAVLMAGCSVAQNDGEDASDAKPAEFKPEDTDRSRLTQTEGSTSTFEPVEASQSSLTKVDALKSELGARETDRGTLVSLPGDILFDFDKATITSNAKPVLNRLAELIGETKPAGLAIEGHTDSKGSDAYNDKLSADRAASVKAYLAANGVDDLDIEAKGFGEDRPVAKNQSADGSDNPDGRQKNRRVEVTLLR